MTLADGNTQPDTPEVREYNRKRRWLEIGDLIVSFGFLIALLATGWTNTLSGLARRMGGDHYWLNLFLYVLFLSLISKVLGFALDFYGFRLEHQFNLSNQHFGSWIKDEMKGWVLGLVLGAILAEIVYALIRTSPQYWWVLGWLIFIALFVFFAQIARKKEAISKHLAIQLRHIEIARGHRLALYCNLSYVPRGQLLQRPIRNPHLYVPAGFANRIVAHLLVWLHIQSNRTGFCTAINRAQRNTESLLKAGESLCRQEISTGET